MAENNTTREPRWFLGSRLTVLAAGADTNGAYGLMEQQAAQGFSPPLHCHQREDDAYLVLEGELTFQLEGEEHVALPGDHVFLPRGIPHTFRVDSAQARWLEIVTPAGAEQWHLDCSDPATSDGLPEPAPINIERIARTIGAYDIDIVGPPLPSAGN